MSVIGGASQGGVVDVGDIGHSLRFRSAANANLSRNVWSSPNRQTFAVAVAVKRGKLGSIQTIYGAYDGSSASASRLYFDANDKLAFDFGGAVDNTTLTNAVFRDPTSHLLVLFVLDTTQAQTGHSASDSRVRIYVDGVQQTTSGTLPGQNVDSQFYINGRNNLIGVRSTTDYFDGLMSRFASTNGNIMSPSDIWYLNTESNAWVTKSQAAVKAVVDAGGANSFMLDFDDGTSLTTLGYDKSSKGNNWTLNNFSLTAGVTYDWMLDTPTNNFAVLNPLRVQAGISAMTYAEANLRAASTSNAAGVAASSVEVSSGKWYAEFSLSNALGATTNYVGVLVPTASSGGSRVYNFDGSYWNGSGYSAYGASYTNGDWIGVALDMDSQTLEFFKNGVSQGQKTSIGLAGQSVLFYATSFISGGVSFIYANFGQRPFAYTPPAGFKSLCTANLPDGETITTSGGFTGNAAADGPYIDLKGVPTAMTINGNAVTFGTHADKTAFGFKVRDATASYNTAGSNTYSITSTGAKRKYSNAQGNP